MERCTQRASPGSYPRRSKFIQEFKASVNFAGNSRDIPWHINLDSPSRGVVIFHRVEPSYSPARHPRAENKDMVAHNQKYL